MALCDFNSIWDGAHAYFQTIDIKAGVEALALRRGDTLYTAGDPAYSPEWRMGKGTLDVQEDALPIGKLDVLDWPHQSAQKSGDNYCQFWYLQGLIALAVLGATREIAERRALDAAAVVINAWLGVRAKMPTPARPAPNGLADAGVGFITSWLTGGGWRTTERSDGFVSQAQLLVTIDCKVTLPRT